MRLLIVRHGDPDYAIDSLTPTGHIEAELLSDRISRLNVKEFYVSPLGRAQATAAPTLKKMGRTAITLDWLREFPVSMRKPGYDKPHVCWDWLPQYWVDDPRYYDPQGWMDVPLFAEAGARQEWEKVIRGFDGLLAEHGYVRCGNSYRTEKGHEDTIVLFCHFGLECVLLGHLMNVSPMPLWHGICAAPSSVTTVYTEEREKGIVSFRASAVGDTSHLYAAGRKPSFAARYCETYDNMDQMH